MRITDRMLVSSVLSNIQRNAARLEDLQTSISSGRRIRRPSDDPSGAVRALVLRGEQDESAQNVRNLDAAEGWLTSSDAALREMIAIMQRARELTVQGGNQTLSPTEERALGSELDQLLQHALQVSNAKHGDQYLFGGFSTKSGPFSFTDSTNSEWEYSGDNGRILRTIAPGVRLPVNITGDRVFPQLFDALIAVRDDMRAANYESLSQDRLNDIDAVMDELTDAAAEVGATANRVELTRQRVTQTQVTVAAQLSVIEEIDYADAIVRLTSEANIFQAALATGARITQPKLLDFLR